MDSAGPEIAPGRTEAQEEESGDEQRPAFTVNDRRFWNLEQEEIESELARAQAPSFVEQLQQQLTEKDRQLREYIAAYKQEVGEGLQKTKDRLERDAVMQLEQLRGQVAEPMMEVLDALERSLAAAGTGGSLESLLQGIQMVQLLMMQKLQALGLERVTTVGHPFDPSLHEAMAVVQVSDPAQGNVILAEFKPGFTLGKRLIRPAQVQVGKLG